MRTARSSGGRRAQGSGRRQVAWTIEGNRIERRRGRQPESHPSVCEQGMSTPLRKSKCLSLGWRRRLDAWWLTSKRHSRQSWPEQQKGPRPCPLERRRLAEGTGPHIIERHRCKWHRRCAITRGCSALQPGRDTLCYGPAAISEAGGQALRLAFWLTSTTFLLARRSEGPVGMCWETTTNFMLAAASSRPELVSKQTIANYSLARCA